VAQAKTLEDEVLEEITGNYYYVQRRDPKKIAEWNESLLEELEDLPLTGVERGRTPGLSRAEIQALYEKVKNHPVASCRKVKKYDPEGNIGFCFGRAMSVHLEALRLGLAKESVRKMWAVGSMKYKDIFWQHHVATMVRDERGRWWVIDPEYRQPKTLRAWFKTVKKMDADDKLQFFSSNANRFGPSNNDTYNPDELASEFYNGYFRDLMRVSREEAEAGKRSTEKAGN
jgi:hypothetical protein